MLAVILGVAVIATIGGSLAFAQTTSGSGSTQAPAPIQGSINLPQNILSSVKTSFTTAANTAAGAIPGGNGQVLSGGLVVKQGYVVYAFKVTDGKNVYMVLVDAGQKGNVLNTPQAHPLTLGSLIGGGMGGGHGMMMHRHFGMQGSWSKPQTPGSTAPSTTTPSGFQE